MKHKYFFLYLIFTTICLLSGCWSKKELNDLALISAIGIDKGDDGRYVGTLQVVDVGNVSNGRTGGQASPVIVHSASGENILEMTNRATSKVSRRLYYAQTNLVVIGEELAKEDGIDTLLDAFDRNAEFRTTAKVVIAHGTTAAEVLKVLSPKDKIPANKILKTLEFTEKRQGEGLNLNIREITNAIVSPGKEPIITGVRLVGDDRKGSKLDNIQQTVPVASIEGDGLAIFKDGKLIDWFDGEVARGTIWILNKIKGTIVNINWKGEKEAIGLFIIRQQTKVAASMKKGQPNISIDARAEAEVGEVKVPVNLSDPRVLEEIEKSVEKEIKKELRKSIEQAQKNKTDIFGFGEALHRSDPRQWKKLKDDWHDIHFPELKIHIKVEAHVRRSGLRNKSYLSDLESSS